MMPLFKILNYFYKAIKAAFSKYFINSLSFLALALIELSFSYAFSKLEITSDSFPFLEAITAFK